MTTTVEQGSYICAVVYWRPVSPGQQGYEPGLFKKTTAFHVRHEPFTAKRLAAYDTEDYFVTQQRRGETLDAAKRRALKHLEPADISNVIDGIQLLSLVKTSS